MPLRSAFGVRVGRTPVTGVCRMQASGYSGSRHGGGILEGTGSYGRVRDVRLAQDAAAAVGKGNPLTIGLNGTTWAYRPRSSRQNNVIDEVAKYDTDSNRHIASFVPGSKQLYADVLSALRNDRFRVIQFADRSRDRSVSQIHPYNIDYGDANVSARLRHIPVSQLTCQLDSRGTFNPFDRDY